MFSISRTKRTNDKVLNLQFLYAGFHSIIWTADTITILNDGSEESARAIYAAHNADMDVAIDPRTTIYNDGVDFILVTFCAAAGDIVPLYIDGEEFTEQCGADGCAEFRVTCTSLCNITITALDKSHAVEVIQKPEE